MRIAALDLGSNSFHLLVAEAQPDGHVDALVRDKEMLRLGDVVSRHGVVPPEDADRVVDTVRRFRMLAESVEADRVVAYATSAIRDAENSSDVLDRVQEEAGVKVKVISGLREAELIFRAIRAAVVLDPGPGLALDLGGGSLEVMIGDGFGLHWSASLKLGVARLTADLVRNDPLESGDLRRLRRRVRELLEPVAVKVLPRRPQILVGSSGTLCALARMAEAERTGSVPASVNQLTVRRHDLERVHARLLELTAAERARLPGLEPRRADLVPAGSVVIQEVFELFGFDRLTTSEWALREGMVLEAVGHLDHADANGDPRVIRRTSVLALCRRFDWNEPHARQVARLALDLFDATWALHRLGADDRELLDAAACLHDVGEYVAREGHHRHSAYLIENGRLRGFSPSEVDVLASLARFHRRGEPKTSYEPYARLDRDQQRRVGVLLGLLCVADGLDRTHSQVVEKVEVEVDGDVLRLQVHAHDDTDLELWGVRRKKAALERALGTHVVVSRVE